ncbi:MAG: hypothetical protein NTZ78_08465 [Candidatus Aureabacteria bacterium]|nr:hypothetical protein [Candidatus Auribacterota bacterium]
MKKFACLMVLVLVGAMVMGGCKKKEAKPVISMPAPPAAPAGK